MLAGASLVNSSAIPSTLVSVQTPAADTISAPNNATTNFATTYTFPANAIAVGTVHRITMTLKHVCSGAALTTSFKSTLGGTDACSFTSATQATSGTRTVSLAIDFIGTAAPSATSAVVVAAQSPIGANSAALAPFNTPASTVPTNFATNGTLVFQPQFQASANTAGNSLQLLSMVVEKLA